MYLHVIYYVAIRNTKYGKVQIDTLFLHSCVLMRVMKGAPPRVAVQAGINNN